MKKKSLWIAIPVLTLLGGAVLIGFLLPGIVEKKVKEKLAGLHEQGINLQYDSLRIGFWGNEVVMDSIVLQIPEKEIRVSVHSLKLSSFKVFAFLFRREIHFRKLIIDRPDLFYVKNGNGDSLRVKNQSSPFCVFVDSLRLNHVTIHYLDSVGSDTLHAVFELRMSDVSFNNAIPEVVNFSILRADHAGAIVPFYSFALRHLMINKTLKEVEVDSLIIEPRFKKAEFARRMRVESDRFAGVIRSLRLENVEFGVGDSAYLSMKRLSLNFKLQVYRNKHYPRPVKDHVPLPVMALLKKVPFPLVIDTVRISDSYVSYEEVGEHADSSGTVFFKDIDAFLFNINADSTAPAPVLAASSDFMGQGKLDVRCTFSKGKKRAYLEGSLTGFPLALLNDVLKPQAKLKIETGTLTQMNFNFWFNDIRSDGTVDMNYKDLKVTSLRENKKTEKAVKNELLTLGMNTFLKNDAGKLQTGEKMTGQISFYRDQKKAVFNFWWKSLFSGIKSSFGMGATKTTTK